MVTSTDSTITIQLKHGLTAMIDVADADLADKCWQVQLPKRAPHTYYVYTARKVARKTICYYMHRIILERVIGRPLLKEEVVDHRDDNGLNNRRSNLRLATHAQNIQNGRLSSRNTSGYRGVWLNKKNGRWQARIMANGKAYSLGGFETPEAASEAYQKAAKELYGEFARLD